MSMKTAFWQMYITICDRFVRKEKAQKAILTESKFAQIS